MCRLFLIGNIDVVQNSVLDGFSSFSSQKRSAQVALQTLKLWQMRWRREVFLEMLRALSSQDSLLVFKNISGVSIKS